MKKPILANLGISFVSIIILLIFAELGIRAFWVMSPSVRRPFYQRSKNPFIRYELIPNHKDEKIQINALGFRSNECSINKPSDTFRILLLGDSEIFSVLLSQNERLNNKLEEILNRNSSKVKYEVINTGVEGYGTTQELEVLKTKGLRLKPDLVILNYCLNDPDGGEYHFSDSCMIRHSALCRYVWYRAKKAFLKKRLKTLKLDTEVKFFHYLHSGKLWQTVKDSILTMADICKANNIKLMVNIFPTSSIAVASFENYPYQDIHELIKGIKHDNIIFVDPVEEFRHRGLTPQIVSINYQYNESHKNSEALGVIAEKLYEQMLKSKLLPAK